MPTPTLHSPDARTGGEISTAVDPSVLSSVDTASTALDALALLRRGDTTIETFQDPKERWFAEKSKADIFDVEGGRSQLYRALDDEGLRLQIQEDAKQLRKSRRIRIIFLDGDELDAERLPTTSDTLQFIMESYGISPRYAFFLSRQQMAGSSMHYQPGTAVPRRLEFWYTAVVRTLAVHTPDESRKVMNWLRTSVWSDFDAVTGNMTVLSFRYPVQMKEMFFADFAGSRAAVLQQHPMVLHAHWMERLGTQCRGVNAWFSDSLYKIENVAEALRTPADLFENARKLARVYRQLRQVSTDYDVFLASVKTMKRQTEQVAELVKLYAQRVDEPVPSHELQQQLRQNFKQIRKELKLGRVYLSLYLERCQSGISDSHAVSSQNSAEIQIKTSKDFTDIARDSREDNESLRTIQIMTALFLPPSLMSSIFGMGFFSTSRSGNGDADSPIVYSVSDTWWWYLAVTLPVTVVVLLIMCRDWVSWHPTERRLVWRRRSSGNSNDKTTADIEKLFHEVDYFSPKS